MRDNFKFFFPLISFQFLFACSSQSQNLPNIVLSYYSVLQTVVQQGCYWVLWTVRVSFFRCKQSIRKCRLIRLGTGFCKVEPLTALLLPHSTPQSEALSTALYTKRYRLANSARFLNEYWEIIRRGGAVNCIAKRTLKGGVGGWDGAISLSPLHGTIL